MTRACRWQEKKARQGAGSNRTYTLDASPTLRPPGSLFPEIPGTLSLMSPADHSPTENKG